MKDTEEIEKKIREFGEPIEPNPDLTNQAKLLVEELYGGNRVKKKKKNFWKIFSVSAAACACILVAILVPTLTRSSGPNFPPINRYTDDNLKTERVENIKDFALQNNLTCKYFLQAQQNFLSSVKETNKVAIIEQQYIYIDNLNFDTVLLDICLTNDEFDRFDKFQNLKQNRQVNGINVEYSLTEENDGNTIMAKCEVDSYRYYWNISTLQGAERIDFYINYLFGEA